MPGFKKLWKELAKPNKEINDHSSKIDHYGRGGGRSFRLGGGGGGGGHLIDRCVQV